MTKTGVLLTNTGTPDAPTTTAVRHYLAAFLSDKRVVQLPRFIWLPILYGLILPLRSRRSAKLYQAIWTTHGSPMQYFMQTLAIQLQQALSESIIVEIGMNYGQPSIPHGLQQLNNQSVDNIVILPLFPQYSHTTTASSFDRVVDALKMQVLPHLHFIRSYATHPAYIDALATRVLQTWEVQGKSHHLLISFHGIPKRFVTAGDPYEKECQATAHLLAEKLHLSPDQWTLCYQSQFGYDKWLTPSTQRLFTELPKRNIKEVDIVCPGFSVDCLETLEEIALRGQEIFHATGGKKLRYIPALNADVLQVELLKTLIKIPFF